MNSLPRRDALRLLIAGVATYQHTSAAESYPVWTTGKVPVPGGNVVSRAFGNGRRAPLLMVHGGPSGADSRAYGTMSALGDERKLISWDQLDCGDSDHPNRRENWTHARFVEEMDVVRRKLAPGPVHVIGGSWGSTLAMEWLVTKRPGNVLSVTFVCPGLDYSRTEASRRKAQNRLSPSAAAAFDELARTGNAANPALVAANAEYVRTFVTRNPPREMYVPGRPNPEMMQALFADWLNWSRVKELAELRQPLLLIRGEYDYITDDDVAFYAAVHPRAQTAVIANAAHLAFLDNPEATNAVVRNFLRKWDR